MRDTLLNLKMRSLSYTVRFFQAVFSSPDVTKNPIDHWLSSTAFREVIIEGSQLERACRFFDSHQRNADTYSYKSFLNINTLYMNELPVNLIFYIFRAPSLYLQKFNANLFTTECWKIIKSVMLQLAVPFFPSSRHSSGFVDAKSYFLVFRKIQLGTPKFPAFLSHKGTTFLIML